MNISGTARWNVACTAWVGNFGTGVVNQSGGLVNFNQLDVSTSLLVGLNGHGSYNLSGGVLSSTLPPNFLQGLGRGPVLSGWRFAHNG
jgi:hypothetical protein